MTSLKFTGPDFSFEADWITLLIGACFVLALVYLFRNSLRDKPSPTNSWDDMTVVGSGTADEPSRIELLPRPPVPAND